MSTVPAETLHASCVALRAGRLGWLGLSWAGVLLQGASASGKSDLALRLMAAGGRLVADDRVVVGRKGNALYASAPDGLRGLVEVRGVGVVPARSKRRVRLALAVSLSPGAAIERLPDPVPRFRAGPCQLPLIEIDPFQASAVAKIEAALAVARRLAARGARAKPSLIEAPT